MAEHALWFERLHPEDRERVLEEERRALEHPDESGSSDREYRLIRADGRVVWVWERDTVVRDAAGRPETSQGLLIDVTARKLAEARAQHYLDVAGTILLVLRTDETVDLLNRHGRELIGYGEGDLIGRNWYDIVVPEEDRAGRRANFQRTLRGEEQFTYHQGDIVTRAGERRTIAWRNTLLRGERGQVIGMLSSGEDITERLRAEDEISRLAYFDPLTGLPNRAQLEGRAAPLRDARRALGPGGRAAADRPRQLQARQRLLRPRRGRPAAAADRRAAARRAGRRDARAPRRRRVPDPAARARGRRRGGRAAGRRGGRGAAGGAVQGLGRGVPRPVERRHLALPRGRPRPGRAAPARRHGDVPEQEPRARGLDRLRPGRPRPARAAVAAGAAAARDRRGRARPLLPADRGAPARADRRDGGAAALERPRPRARLPRRLHPRRRGDEPARADRRLGHRRARPADPRMARGGAGAARLLQRLPAPAAPARLRRRADRAAGEPGHRPGVADHGADGIGHAARAGADRADPARARRERPAAGDRRLRRRLVLALAAARAARALAQDRPLVHARHPRRPRARARSSTR